ncbi:MAG: hypothetical protein SO542_01715 [Muribaculaceae bacterium]|nr:hypothetical protein [Muribaculaceae bacterium]MDY5388458.1 hypothetical protein [Muribaculaceae bacterium]
MTTKSAFLHILTLCVAICSVFSVQASRKLDGLDPAWTLYTAYDNLPRKIFDTPDATYFFVHQHIYNTTSYSQYYANPSGGIFRYDKNNPAAGIVDMALTTPFSGFDMRIVAVDPTGDVLAVGYMDGGVDVIKAGKVTYFDDIKNIINPGGSKISGLTIDPATGDVFVSTECGFMQIDGNSLQVKRNIDLGKKVSDVCSVGNRLVAIINGSLYTAPIDANITGFGSFATMSTTAATDQIRLMPLGANDFATLNASGVIYTVSYRNNQWTATKKISDSGLLRAANLSVVNRLEHTLSATATGYYLATTSKAYFINRPADATSLPTVTTISLPGGVSQFSASYDGVNFWFNTERGRFHTNTYSNSTWSGLSAGMRPQCPLTAMDVEFQYSPEYGLVTVNVCSMLRGTNTNKTLPMLVSSYRNGTWYNLAPSFYIPKTAQTDDTALSVFVNNRQQFPIADPMGFAIDPAMPNVLHTSSVWTGNASIYLDDPSHDPILMRSTNDHTLDAFNPYYLLDAQSWSTFNPTYTLGFDSDNNLWYYVSTVFGITTNQTDLVLLCWPQEERLKVLQNGKIDGDPGVKKLVKFYDLNPGFWVYGTALRHPNNKNMLILSGQGSDDTGGSIRLYRHKGTIDDTSDDEMTRIYRFDIEGEVSLKFAKPYCIKENPFTGEVMVGCLFGTVIFNPNDPVINGTIKARKLTTSIDGAHAEIIPDIMGYDLCVDEYGRIWVATYKCGLYGISPDGSEIIAHYTTKNSPIPSDMVYAVGWNPDTKSLFMSTECGLAEVKVDAPVDTPDLNDTETPFVSPTTVTANFSGTVTFHNIPDGTVLRVRDARQNTIRILPAAKCRSAFWDLLDADGKMVPTGLYTISDAANADSFKPFVIPVSR